MKKGLLIFCITAIVVIAVAFYILYLPKDSFARGITVGGEKIGGLSKTQAENLIETKVNEFLEKDITFHFSNSEGIYSKEIKIKDLGVVFDIEKSLEEPFSVGRKFSSNSSINDFFQNTKEKIASLRGNYQFSLIATIDDKEEKEEGFEKFFTENFGKFEIPPQNAVVIFNEKTLDFDIEEPKEGLLFSREKIKKEIEKNAGFLIISDIYLVLEDASPEITQEMALSAANQAKEILKAGPYVLLAEEKRIEVPQKTLGNWFSFVPQKKDNQITLSPSLNEELIQNYLAEISNSINIEARNPVLSFEEGVLKIIIAPKTGKILKIEESAKKIQENILAKEKQISLRFEEVEPKITEEKINELHIEKLIGTGTSNFAGSPKNRIHNIKIATAKFNGMLIAPDEEFSFNQALGEVGPAQGYLPELVIKNNKTVPEYGGGVCQVSTTMFRAAVYSGLEITERKSHAYPVKYYNPQGFDATVYLPSPDLKFKNNTGNWILIQAKIKDNNLTFEFYGKDDGRKVIVKGPYQYDFQEDGSMKARLEEEVWKNGELILKKTFLSFYKSPNLYPTTNAE